MGYINAEVQCILSSLSDQKNHLDTDKPLSNSAWGILSQRDFS